ncbi:Transglutaminase-like domain-containing protein OS=Lysinibacillus sphaericus OX=1421 GN=LYSIN_04139 PE=4 SV=1 [Lysinibacillus sphaericus]
MKKLAIIVIFIVFMEPIYTAGKATVKQVVTWANNDDIETMLLATKRKNC